MFLFQREVYLLRGQRGGAKCSGGEYTFVLAEDIPHLCLFSLTIISSRYSRFSPQKHYKPREHHDLSTLKHIYSTGSPLAPPLFDYVYEHIHPNVLLGSITGKFVLSISFRARDPRSLSRQDKILSTIPLSRIRTLSIVLAWPNFYSLPLHCTRQQCLLLPPPAFLGFSLPVRYSRSRSSTS